MTRRRGLCTCREPGSAAAVGVRKVQCCGHGHGDLPIYEAGDLSWRQPVRSRPRMFACIARRLGDSAAQHDRTRGESSHKRHRRPRKGSGRTLLTSAAGPAACSYLDTRRVLVRRCGQRYASTMSCHPCAGAEIESSRVPRTDQSSALQTCSSPWSTGPNMAITRTGKR